MVGWSECRRAIIGWKRRNNTNSGKGIKELREELEIEDSALVPCEIRNKRIKKELTSYREDESYWRQRSREKWLKEGDRNTKFFQASLKSTRVKNSLQFLLDENGREQYHDLDKCEVALRYFIDLFKSSNPEEYHSVWEGFQPRVIMDMNMDLTREISIEESKLWHSLSIVKKKAPRQDGFTGLFFKKYWDILKDQIVGEVRNFSEQNVSQKNGIIHI